MADPRRCPPSPTGWHEYEGTVCIHCGATWKPHTTPTTDRPAA